MAKHKSHEGLILGAGAAVAGFFLWQKYGAQITAAATAAATPATTDTAASTVTTVNADGSTTTTDPTTGVTTTTTASGLQVTPSATTTQLIVPAVPLNSTDVNLGTVNGTTYVAGNAVQTPYGTVIPTDGVDVPDPLTGIENPVVTVPASTQAAVVTVPTTTAATTSVLQPATDICANLTSFANNNPAGANGDASYATLHAGLIAAFQELWNLQRMQPTAFTISAIANYWANVVGDGSGPNQTAFENSMVSLTGLPDYSLEPSDQATMLKLMRGIIGTVRGAQYYSVIPDACLAAAYNGS